jgi:hypothetical protein
MPILSIETIQQNPWNVLSYDLPASPSRLLLTVAQLAATCCRHIAQEIMEGIDQDVDEPWLLPGYSEALDQWSRSHRKIGQICFILRDEFDVPVHDFWLSRSS